MEGGEAVIGERLQELRKDHGMSQMELAQKLHVSFHTISSYERDPDAVLTAA